MADEKPQFLTVGTGADTRDIAWRLSQGPKDRPLLVWLGGYRSDMKGTKALELEGFAHDKGLACLRLDYSGHGESGGEFRDGSISRWLEEALAVIAHTAFQRLILVGSSMGGWIALRAVAELRKAKTAGVEGMVLIAPAPDFTMDLIEPSLGETERKSLADKGYFEEHSEYSPEPNIFTAKLMDDGRANRVLTGIIETGCPVHILQGMNDPDVPWRHAMKLVEHLPADDVVISLVKDGDHRLSRPEDLALMRRALAALLPGDHG
ncbi:pimeloyl-ACP methyl ester carboxylesterase [Rhizobium aquaticum]|uniref:Palmitoyl-protein thioesterase ABHD10, mitochondrial n=1 Tax=Rhizobium aquaticum TaxID=1549636 RepID=A0ABV2IZ71_9HYPH